MLITKLSRKEAEALDKKFVSSLFDQKKGLRAELAQIASTNVYEMMSFDSFDSYCKKRFAEAEIHITVGYARREAHAGLVEKTLFGDEGIGTMKEGALRPLYDNVDEHSWIKVFKRAKKFSASKNPTGAQLIRAAKILKVYKQQESKLKQKVRAKAKIKVGGKSLFNTAKSRKEPYAKKPKSNPEVSKSQSNPISLDDAPIKSYSSNQALKHLIKKYKGDDLEVILGSLKASKNKKLKHSCNYILTHCKDVAVKNLITKLTKHCKKISVKQQDHRIDIHQ